MPYGVPQISPYEAQNFASQRAVARRKLLSGRAQNQYRRTLAGFDFTRGQRDLNRQFAQRREALPTDYIRRGIFRSGIYGAGLQQYSQDRLNAFSDLQRAYQNQLGGLTFADRDLEDAYAEALAQIQGNEFARRAQTAAQLRSVL